LLPRLRAPSLRGRGLWPVRRFRRALPHPRRQPATPARHRSGAPAGHDPDRLGATRAGAKSRRHSHARLPHRPRPCHRGRRPGDPGAAVRRAADARLPPRGLRRAQVPGHRDPGLRAQREADGAVQGALLELARAVGRQQRLQLHRPRLPEHLGRDARTTAWARVPRTAQG